MILKVGHQQTIAATPEGARGGPLSEGWTSLSLTTVYAALSQKDIHPSIIGSLWGHNDGGKQARGDPGPSRRLLISQGQGSAGTRIPVRARGAQAVGKTEGRRRGSSISKLLVRDKRPEPFSPPDVMATPLLTPILSLFLSLSGLPRRHVACDEGGPASRANERQRRRR